MLPPLDSDDLGFGGNGISIFERTDVPLLLDMEESGMGTSLTSPATDVMGLELLVATGATELGA